MSLRFCVLAVWLVSACSSGTAANNDKPSAAAQLVDAARRGDVAEARKLIESGADPNAPVRFNITALWQASSKGHVEMVEYLLSVGAKTDVRDSVWKTTPLLLAEDTKIITMLTKAGAQEAGRVLRTAAESGDVDQVNAVLASGKIRPGWLMSARAHAARKGQTKVIDLLDKASDTKIAEPPKIAGSLVETYVGRYVSSRLDELQVSVAPGSIAVRRKGLPRIYIPRNATTFDQGSTTLRFEIRDGQPVILESSYSGRRLFVRTKARGDVVASARRNASSWKNESQVAVDTWPSFRGVGARGIAAQQNLPERFDVGEDQGVAWKTKVAGLANACPVIWQDKIFVCTAVSSKGDNSLRIGIYGAGDAVKDDSKHSWQVICLNANTGKPIWKRVSKQAIPPTKRHTKSSQANSTPATDGKVVVALFPFGGLYCYDIDGTPKWDQQLGVFDSGAFNDPDYQWGFGSSPIIYRNLVVVQCDVQKGSFIAAFDVRSGELVWRVERDEVPSWGTPTVIETKDRPILVANGTNFVRGYDIRDGKEVWRLGGNAAITVPTPFMAQGLIYVTSGYRPIQPIFAIRPDATGDITLAKGETTNRNIVWSKDRGGPYLPSPIVYGDYLYTCQNHGILSCYDAKTGEQVYRKRMGSRGASFTASIVAADGRLYLTAETGDVHVIQAGPEFKRLAICSLGEYCLTTPAIAGGRMVFRTQNHLIAIGKK